MKLAFFQFFCFQTGPFILHVYKCYVLTAKTVSYAPETFSLAKYTFYSRIAIIKTGNEFVKIQFY